MSFAELEGLNLPQLIDQLVDVAVPAPISYAPETTGWWLLAASVSVGVALATMFVRRSRQRNSYRRLALQELAEIEARSAQTPSPTVFYEVAVLVRRTALTVFPRHQVAHLYGDAWREFLNHSASRDLGAGIDGLILGPYQSTKDQLDVAASIAAARNWIEAHHD